MKKRIATHLLTLALALIVTIGGYYPDVGRIVAIDDVNDLVTVRTCDGFLWMFHGVEDLCLGDMLGLMFFDRNNTPDYIFDDEIADIKYAGLIGDYYMPDDALILEELPLVIEDLEPLPEEIIIDLPDLELVEIILD